MSKKGHVPIRMCIGCRKRRKKAEMVRFTRNDQGIVLAIGKKGPEGRGFYLCREVKCLRIAEKRMNQEGLQAHWISASPENTSLFK